MTNRSPIILAIILLITIAIIWFKHPSSQSSKMMPNDDTLIVGTNAEFPPFSYIENDQIIGFDIDVIKEIAKRLNKKITFVNMSFEALIPELQIGTIAVIAAGMTPTEERAQRVFFTSPHFSGDPLLAITKKSAPAITKPEQLLKKTIVVNQGYTADQYITKLGVSDVVRLSTPLISTGLLALNSGQADVFVAAKSSLQPFLAQQKENYTVAIIPGTAESSALAVSKKYPVLFTTLETTISDMIKDGTIATLQKKWNLHD
jgi:ABC-type amino acid transport substrate-binding protein